MKLLFPFSFKKTYIRFATTRSFIPAALGVKRFFIEYNSPLYHIEAMYSCFREIQQEFVHLIGPYVQYIRRNKIIQFVINHKIRVFLQYTQAPYISYRFNLLQKKREITLFLLPLIIATMVSSLFPSFTFIFTTTIIGLSLFFSLSGFTRIFLKRHDDVLKHVISILHITKVLSYIEKIHIFVFYKINTRGFVIVTTLVFSLSIIYVALLRYYSFMLIYKHHVFSHSALVLIDIIFFIGLIAIYIRLLISLSLIIIPITRRVSPEFLDSILRVIPELPETKSSSSANHAWSLLTLNKNTHNHHHLPPIPRFSGWQKAGIIGGLITVSLGVYNARNQVLQLDEFRRQNDLEEVSQGMLSREEYQKRWKR